MLTEIPWALISRPLVIDTHTHTHFSDGKYSVDKVVQLAINNGCDALAITDHSDLSEEAATPDYFTAINAARKKNPGFILFGGIEWNIPPYSGREHVTVLLEPALEESILGEFKQQFEQDDATAEHALKWLAGEIGSTSKSVLIYNHPSRKDDDPDENFKDILNWRNTNHLFIGFAGAPGHQKTQHTGSYRNKFLTQDRWDPVAAEIGGTWDQLLDLGHNVYAALAVSDYHNEKMDYAPCEFARIHVSPEDRTAARNSSRTASGLLLGRSRPYPGRSAIHTFGARTVSASDTGRSRPSSHQSTTSVYGITATWCRCAGFRSGCRNNR